LCSRSLRAGAAAQTAPTTLTGVVVDATGGVLPSAQVQLSQGGRVVQLVTIRCEGSVRSYGPCGAVTLTCQSRCQEQHLLMLRLRRFRVVIPPGNQHGESPAACCRRPLIWRS